MIRRLYHRNSLFGGALVGLLIFLSYLGSFVVSFFVLIATGLLALYVNRGVELERRSRATAVAHGRKIMRTPRESKENRPATSPKMFGAKVSSSQGLGGLFNHESFTTYLKSPASLPRVRRVQGHAPNNDSFNLSAFGNLSPLRTTRMAQRRYPTHQPQYSRLGLLPSVHLHRSQKPVLGDHNHGVGSPQNTVKIAPPDVLKPPVPSLPHPTSTPSKSPEQVAAYIHDRETVLTALREKRKRNHRDDDTHNVSSPQDHFSKRRRQHADRGRQDAADVTSHNGAMSWACSAPGGVKRQAGSPLTSDESSDSGQQANKRSRPEDRSMSARNAIDVSFSSSRRWLEKQLQRSRSNSRTGSLSRESSLRHSRIGERSRDSSISLISTEGDALDLLDASRASSRHSTPRRSLWVEDKSRSPTPGTSNEPPLSVDDTAPVVDPKRKMFPFTKKGSSRPRSRPIQGKVSTDFSKVPSLRYNLTAEDYKRDREADLERVQQMLEEVQDVQAVKSQPSQVESEVAAAPAIATLSGMAQSSGITPLAGVAPLASIAPSAGIAPASLAVTTSASVSSAFSVSEAASPSTVTTSAAKSASESTKIHSLAGLLGPDSLASQTLVSTAAGLAVAASVAPASSVSAPSFQFGTSPSVSQLGEPTTTSTTTSASAPLPTFKPVFGATPTTTSATCTSSVPTVGGFSFAATSTSDTASSSAPFTFGQISSSGPSLQTTSSGQALQSDSSGQTVNASSGLTFSSGLQVKPATGGSITSGIPLTSAAAQKAPFSLGNQNVSSSATLSSTTLTAGFTFGGAKTQTDTTAPSIGGTPSQQSTLSMGSSTTNTNTTLAFGATSTTTSASKPIFQFGTTNTQPSAAAGAFGAQAAPSFNFPGKPPQPTPTQSASPAAFTFGAAAAQPTSQSTGGGFGSSSTAASGTFPMGAPATTTSANSNGFTATASSTFAFGQSAPNTSASSTFGFGQSAQTTTASPAFGQTAPTTTAPGFGIAGGFSFNAKPATTTSTPAFGQTGSGVTAPAPSTGTAPPFGATGGFNFSAKPATTTPAFGAPVTTSSSGFGTNQSQPSSGFQFGATNSNSTTNMFGASNTGSNTAPFGASNTGSNTAPFGASNTGSNTAPFGASNTGSNTAPFGASSNTSGNAFGASNATNPFGSSQPSNAASPFGGPAPNVAPFGHVSSKPGFSSSTDNKPGAFQFGAGNNHTTTATFGQATNTFGSSSSNSQNVFGAKPQTNAFGSSSSTNTFGSSTSNSDTFGSGFTSQNGLPQPSQSAFGSGNASQAFNFSAATENKPSFAFGGATTPTVVGQSTPNLGASPAFGTPTPSSGGGMFSMGSGTTGARQRPISRARRRNTKK